jgi:hypothetical protein
MRCGVNLSTLTAILLWATGRRVSDQVFFFEMICQRISSDELEIWSSKDVFDRGIREQHGL